MNHIVKDIIKVANMSNQEEKSKILILSQLLNKTEDLIKAIQTPKEEIDSVLDEHRRWTLMEVEGKMRRLEEDLIYRVRFILESERRQSGL